MPRSTQRKRKLSDDEMSNEEVQEEEYKVEDIIGHKIQGGRTLFRVVWKGYNDPNDDTWEPEKNLGDDGSQILEKYLSKIGGRDKLSEKPAKKPRRPPIRAATKTTERPRETGAHPAAQESFVKVQKAFKPPAGSWEDHIIDVEMFRADDGALCAVLTGHRRIRGTKYLYEGAGQDPADC